MKEIKLLPLASGSLNMFENLVNYERDKTSIKFPSASNTFENLVNYERDKTII